MALTVEQIEALGATVVAGRVIHEGQFVDGVFTDEGFSPLEGTSLHGKKPPVVKKGADKADADKDAK